jgi:hypothetical protein
MTLAEILRFAQDDSALEEESLRHFYVYMLASVSGVLYVGMTNDLVRRL